MCWRKLVPVARDGIDVVLLRQGDDLFSRLGWFSGMMAIKIERWMMLSVCFARASELRQYVFASIKRLEGISFVVLMNFTLQCMNTT